MTKHAEQGSNSYKCGDVLGTHPAASGHAVGSTVSARQQRALRLGGGVSIIALAAMLGTAPAHALPLNHAQVSLTPVPAASSSAGFVTAGAQQQNTASAIAAALNAATGSSTVTGNSASPLPGTATVSGNDLAAYATGNAQTSGVDIATIGESATANGIAVLAEQSNAYTNTGDDPVVTTPTTINSSVNNSYADNTFTNAADGDALVSSGNLITGQATGNIALSSVTGVVPTTYTDEGTSGTTLVDGTGGSATGNIVVGSSQMNSGLQAGAGSYSTLSGNNVNLVVDSSGVGPTQYLTLSTTQAGNTISSVFTGNSANNDIGVALTSGTLAGAPTLYGSLVVANQQVNQPGTISGVSPGIGASNTHAGIYTGIYNGIDGPQISLDDGATSQAGNVISSSAIGNSAVGATSTAPGNEITLGVDLAGTTAAQNNSSDLGENGGLQTGADLAVSNLQNNTGAAISAASTDDYIGTYVQNVTASTIGVLDNAVTANGAGNVASNVIQTAPGVGINLISGMAALNNAQGGDAADVTATTDSAGITASAQGYNGEDLGSVTNATESVADNSITSMSNINQATNSIALAASTINAGPVGEDIGPAIISSDSAAVSSVGAGVSLNNQQIAESNSHAYVGSAYIGAFAGSDLLSNDSLNVTNPTFSTQATGNNATNNIALTGSQSVSGAAGLLSNQVQVDSEVVAAGEDNNAAVAFDSVGEDNDLTNATGVLSGTSISTDATANNVSNALIASGGQLADGTGGSTGLDTQTDGPFNLAQASADLALSNVQDAVDGPALAVSGEDSARVVADSEGGALTNSTFTLGGPAANAPSMQALAIGNEASNGLSATAATVLSDSAGLLNAQANFVGAGAVLAGASATVNVNTDNDSGDVSGSSINVGSGAVGGSDGNILRALAYDNQATNTLAASAGTLNLVEAAGGVQGSVIPLTAPYDTVGEDNTGVAAAYGLLNAQQASGEDSAAGEDSTIGAFIGNDTTNPTVADVTASTAGNALIASDFGNQSDNSATIAAGNLAATTYYPAANVTNLQTADVSSGATLQNTGGEAFTTQLLGDGGVTGSTLGVSGNTALTQNEANEASNSLDTTGGNIVDTAAAPGLSGLSVDTGVGDLADANLAFTVQNIQDSDSSITSAQTGMNALLSVGGAVDVSTLLADDNTFQSTAYSNNATNTLAFGAAGSPVDGLDASAGVQNVQTADGGMTVTLGAPGTPAVAATPGVTVGAVPYSVVSGNNQGVISGDGGTLTVTGGPLVFNVSDLSGAALTDFEALFSGGTAASGTFTLAPGTYTLTDTSVFPDGTLYFTSGSPVSEQSTSPFTEAGSPAVAATPASPSVVISAAGDISGSTLDLTGNAFDATAIGNAAVNTADITASSLLGGAGIPAGTANANVNGTVTTALADYALSNVQSVSAPITAAANGEVAINPDNMSAITGSTLTVSDNTQLAKAEANVADNTLSLAATGSGGVDSVSPTAALVSNQTGTGSVAASVGGVTDGTTFGETITAPGAITGSTLTMDGNSTEALAVVNDVTNLLAPSATTLDTANATTANAAAGIPAGVPTATADYALNNVQSATGANSVTATAVSQVLNADSTSPTTSGLVDSAVDLSGNSTVAHANANIATNTLNMSATNSSATGALTNSQGNDDAVTATGLSTVQFALNGGAGAADAAALNSTVNVTDNSLSAQAIGNQATNALNAATGASYGSQLSASGAPVVPASASATYAVLNSQNNAGAVTATAPGGNQYAVALNSGGATTPVGAATINVSYNTMNAAAFGNSATNTATVSALNSGNATVALQNVQTNTGAIASSITGSAIGASVGAPGISGATIGVGNNSIVSTAVGNTATNTIVH